ncbi:DUF896 domain-containing protein [Paenibacillus yanchengensis]|uniref:UPF0291 protein ACFSJH_18740 n=1 Tax=Paenibacillus yanchengensis TaxID=2035833 RepID=A0ABW4YPV9_9BACL
MNIDQLIARINELSRKQKATGLTTEEVVERDNLRQQYLQNFKSNMRQELDRIKFVDEEEEGQLH